MTSRNHTRTSVAVVIPCYNAATWVSQTIESVLRQSLPGTQVIVVDDGSSDGSPEIVSQFEEKVTLEVGPNRGACHARNRGHALARAAGATYIMFLDADDYLEGEVLAGALETARINDADIVLSNMHLEYKSGRRDVRKRYEGRIEPEALFEGWMKGDYVNPSAILWRSAFVDRIGGWDESLARAQDLDVTLRAMFFRPIIYKNEQGAAIHARLNPNSISQNQSRLALHSRYRANRGLVERARGTTFAPYIPLVCREIYHIARSAFKAGFIDLGREAFQFVRSEGYREDPGTRKHALSAKILGLEHKVRLLGG